MAPKKRKSLTIGCSPAQKSAKEIKKKYRGKRMSPDKKMRVRRALYNVCNTDLTLRKAASDYGLSYGFLYRRYSGEVDIEKLKGPNTIFTQQEEEGMALWLSEMAKRGMGLRTCEFLDFVQEIVKKEHRKTPFKDGRPGYHWYVAFRNRNSHIIAPRTETPLELKRSKLTKDVTDKWYTNFRDFLISIGCLDKPSRIWNCDETGFSMGSNKAKVIGPSNRDSQVPHITGGKQRLTVMYCGSASGQMIPLYFVYPEPKPRSYNPLSGATEGSDIAFTKKGWMDGETFGKFINHFDKFAGQDRPVVLLLDSVSSHVNNTAFMNAKSKGIELYRIVPNATHLMQPLDKGVFGPLKSKWHLVARKYTRENPGRCIGKEIFAQKLTEAFLQFYKPLTIINAFRSSGIYPVDATVITSETLRPAQTFASPSDNTIEEHSLSQSIQCEELSAQKKAKGALEVFEETLSTPVRLRYQKRFIEGYDVEGQSPCYDVYRKLHDKAQTTSQKSSSGETHSSSSIQLTGLDVLANSALLSSNTSTRCDSQDVPKKPLSLEETNPSSSFISPVLSESLVFPRAPDTLKPVRRTLLDTLPDNLTSPECIRTISLKQLDKIKRFAERERKAKLLYLRKQSIDKTCRNQRKGSSKANPKKGKRPANAKSVNKSQQKVPDESSALTSNDFCTGCLTTWDEDLASGDAHRWIQCDNCDSWMHVDCIASPIHEDQQFICPECD